MGTHYCLTITFDSVPTTGGSGGDAAPNKNIWAHPEPQATFGMNSNFVYGANVAVACPLNFQVALGSNVQICINPTAFETLFGDGATSWSGPSYYHQILGSGPGGNMQFTMGTSANFVVGQIYDINLGPRRITLDLHNQTMLSTLTKGLTLAIMLEVIVFVFAYGLIQDDDWRAGFVIAFQVVTQILLMVVMDVQGLYYQMDNNARTLFNQAFQAHVSPPGEGETPPPDAIQPDMDDFLSTMASPVPPNTSPAYAALGMLEAMAFVVIMLMPVLFEIHSETKLHHPNPPDATGGDTF